MTNGDRAKKFLAKAAYYRELMESALVDGQWNTVVRHAQEVVELGLKGCMSFLLVETPRTHDPAAFFVETLARRGVALTEAEASDVREVSKRLADMRAPVFYEEIEETETDAIRAAEGARRIHALCGGSMVEAEATGERIPSCAPPGQGPPPGRLGQPGRPAQHPTVVESPG